MSSKAMRRSILVMVILLAAVIGGYFLVDHIKGQQEAAEQAEADSLKLISFAVDSVEAIDIQMADGHFHTAIQDGAWVLTDTDYRHTFKLSSYYLSSVASYMSGLTAAKKNKGADPAEYGFSEPVTITCTAGGKDYTLLVGNGSAIKDYYYVMLPGDPAVYSVDYNQGEVLRGGLNYIMDSYVLDFYDVSITAISLERDGETAFSLKQDDAGQWHMEQPDLGSDVSTTQVTSLLNVLTRMEYQDLIGFEEDLALADYGLDAPAYRLTVTDADKTITYLFADYDENDGTVNMLDTDTGQVGAISIDSAGFLQTRAEELTD